jgi:hypothetical protein
MDCPHTTYPLTKPRKTPYTLIVSKVNCYGGTLKFQLELYSYPPLLVPLHTLPSERSIIRIIRIACDAPWDFGCVILPEYLLMPGPDVAIPRTNLQTPVNSTHRKRSIQLIACIRGAAQTAGVGTHRQHVPPEKKLSMFAPPKIAGTYKRRRVRD